MWWKFVIVAVLGYLIGGINFATVFAKLNKKNIRDMGSGNPGTMNMMRNLGAKWGALTFVCDALKGTISALLGSWIIGTVTGMYAGGLGAVLGHIYPIYSGLKGGKGVATAIGVFFATSPLWSLGTFVFILIVIGALTSLAGQARPSEPLYTDDAYYWPVMDTVVPSEPVYDKNIREFIFLEDTTQSPDTVVMRIIEK